MTEVDTLVFGNINYRRRTQWRLERVANRWSEFFCSC